MVGLVYKEPCSRRQSRQQAGFGYGFSRVLIACVLFLVVLLHAGLATASGKERLSAFQRDVESLKADFRQVVTDKMGKVLQDSSGTVLLARPFRFRWDFQTPYEQVVVSDGVQVWFYDADLEQVTIRKVNGDLGSGVALFLSASSPVEDEFRLEELQGSLGKEWVLAMPKKKNPEFDRIKLGFAGGNPEVIELEDSFGQVTRLEFSNFERNPSIGSERFSFVPPAGVDVLRSGGD